ncbi:YgaC family protein [Actinoplanes sp. KI2]|uniref:YgaC family protein n=1 Tax=Actinoplanes sp. KI2 TaxID=2983315 RepID=UPI0021D5C2B7|nr:YgaC family protein [Actinoplanes sp. KI2]MCU7723568.1 YgaC family protein [Actinoplanes sp. KI2]
MAVHMRYTKWGGKRHWWWSAEELGSDRFGWWFGSRAGTALRRGFEEPVIVRHDFVVLVPDEGRWIAAWNGPEETQTALYIDVTDKPVRHRDRVEAVDLDLDVIRLRDGTVRLLDEDEFEEHQVLYGYPAEEIAQARATADELLAMVTARREPFGEVGEAWLAAYSAAR